jgi:hypothetical protein
MQSAMLEQALKGDDTALLNLTYLIENHKMMPDDLLYLQKNREAQDGVARQHYLYLLGFLYYCGAENFTVDYDKSKRLLESCADEYDNVYAKHILAFSGISAFQAEKIQALNDSFDSNLNPLIVLNLFREFKPTLPTHLNQTYTNISKLAVTYKKLFSTYYRDTCTKAINDYKNDLIHWTETRKDESVDSTMPSTLFRDQNSIDHIAKKTLSKAWLELAALYKNIGFRTDMFDAYQRAAKLNNKYVHTCLDAISKDRSFKFIKTYLTSHIEISNIVMMRLQKNKVTDLELNNILFNATVEFNNCKMLFEHFYPLAASKEADELTQLMNQCDVFYKCSQNRVLDTTGPKLVDAKYGTYQIRY